MPTGERARISISAFLKIRWESFSAHEIIYFNIWLKSKPDIAIYENRFVVIYKRKAIVYNSTPIHKDLKFAESQLENFISQLMVA